MPAAYTNKNGFAICVLIENAEFYSVFCFAVSLLSLFRSEKKIEPQAERRKKAQRIILIELNVLMVKIKILILYISQITFKE